MANGTPGFRSRPQVDITGIARLIANRAAQEEQIRQQRQSQRQEQFKSILDAAQVGANLAQQASINAQRRLATANQQQQQEIVNRLAESFMRPAGAPTGPLTEPQAAQGQALADAARIDPQTAARIQLQQALPTETPETIGPQVAELAGLPQEAANFTLPQAQFVLANKQQGERLAQAEAADLQQRAEKIKQQNIKTEKDLRKEFNDDAKQFKVQRDSLERVRATASLGTGPGDLALIFSFMKAQDPNSVVRESEFRNAETSVALLTEQKVPTKLLQLRNRILNGGRLTVAERKRFVKAAEAAVAPAQRQHQKRIREFRRLAKNAGVSPENVIVDITAAAATPKTKTQIRTAKPEELTDEELDAEIRRLRGGK